MKHHFNGYRFAACATVVAAVGCGSTPMPKELAYARNAYSRAASSDAAKLTPDAVDDAHSALAVAEASYQNDEDEDVMRDKAYLALRKAELAQVLASTERARQTEAQVLASMQQNRAVQADQNARLAATQRALRQSNQMLANEAARAESEREARLALTKVAKANALDIRDTARGTVVTVKVPFATGKSNLPAGADEQLAPLADALKLTRDREILVEGHTDSQGSPAKNLDLSQKRAETVREYLISREVPSDKVSATGVGENNPPDDNATAEGRANNRVVQIVVKGRPGEE
jgi:outer membrane protein OmpA-like peptidoglycan-associated protein